MPKFLIQSSGNIAEQATVAVSAGAGSAAKVPELNSAGVLDVSIINAATTGANKLLLTDGTGRIDASTLPTGIGADTGTVTASEALAAGDYVNIWNSSGAKVRKADANSGKPAHGFVLAAVASGGTATVYFEGSNTSVTGQTAGDVFLSATTPGQGTATAPSTAGQIVQKIGFAYSGTAVNFQYNIPITIA